MGSPEKQMNVDAAAACEPESAELYERKPERSSHISNGLLSLPNKWYGTSLTYYMGNWSCREGNDWSNPSNPWRTQGGGASELLCHYHLFYLVSAVVIHTAFSGVSPVSYYCLLLMSVYYLSLYPKAYKPKAHCRILYRRGMRLVYY